MDEEGVECSRCGATFASQDELMVHAMDTHSGIDAASAVSADAPAWPADESAAESTREGESGPTTERDDRQRGDGGTAPSASGLDPETVERLTAVLEAQSAGDLTVNYRQRFLVAASLVVLALVVAVSYLHLTDVIDTTVYMFSLGTLFGLTLSFLQAFLQAVVG